MLELYKSELRRFARWALGLGLLHAVGLFLLDRSFPWMRDDAEIAVVFGFVYAVAGAIFGFYQFASYARTNHWIALLHRPLPTWRIFAAVAGASAGLLFAAVSIPLLVFTAALTLQVGRVVDLRHWPLALDGGLIALVGFGVGGYLALAPRRYGWTSVVAVSVLILTSLGTGPAALFLPLLIIAVLAVLLAGAFELDRSLPPSRLGRLAPTVFVAALSLYFLLIGGSGLVYQLGLAAVGRNPEMNAPPAGGPVEASRARSNEVVVAGLAAAAGAEVASVRRQLQGVEADRLPVAFGHRPVRGELTNSGSISVTGAGKGIRWTYSHDTNTFKGVRLMDGRAVGELRPPGGFATPPILFGEGSMVAGDSLYRLDPGSGVLERRLQLPAGETIVAVPVALGPVLAVLGDRALHFSDSDSLVAVPLQGLIGDLQRLDIARLRDRTIVSFSFGHDSIEGPARAWQRVVSVAPDGTVRTLAQRTLEPDYSEVLRFRSYWLSPSLRAMVAWARQIGSASTWIPRREPIEVPRNVWIAAGLLSLAAAAATAFLARRRRLRPAQSAAWAFAALVLGIPLLAAFWLVRPSNLTKQVLHYLH